MTRGHDIILHLSVDNTCAAAVRWPLLAPHLPMSFPIFSLCLCILQIVTKTACKKVKICTNPSDVKVGCALPLLDFSRYNNGAGDS